MLGDGSAFGVLEPKTLLVAAAALGVAAVIFVIDRVVPSNGAADPWALAQRSSLGRALASAIFA